MASKLFSSYVDFKELGTICNELSYLSRADVSFRRKELFDKINGDLFYHISYWPTAFQRMLWKNQSQIPIRFNYFFLCAGMDAHLKLLQRGYYILSSGT